jgi:NAD(P)-dependent dehydrogenase (short-subunit alcohol dehydrogenase family)
MMEYWNDGKAMNTGYRSMSRVAMITGAAGSIGRAVAGRLGEDGWKVAGVDLNKADADLFLRVDVTDRAAMKAAVARISKELGPIGLLVTAAADYEKNPIAKMDLARWQRMLGVWLGGSTNACAAVVPRMIDAGGGAVVLLSADLSRQGGKHSYAAAASGTVTAFAKSFACEVAADGVRVNCLSVQPPANPDWVAQAVNFLATEGQYVAGQVMGIQA